MGNITKCSPLQNVSTNEIHHLAITICSFQKWIKTNYLVGSVLGGPPIIWIGLSL